MKNPRMFSKYFDDNQYVYSPAVYYIILYLIIIIYEMIYIIHIYF